MPLDIGGQPQTGSYNFLGGYGALGRMAKRYYDPHRAWKNITAKRQGSVSGGLTYDHISDLTYNPLKYSVLSPSRELTKPILNGQGGSTRPRTGAFTLDMLDWNANLSQLTGSTLGVDPPMLGPESVGSLPPMLQDPLTFLAGKDIDPFVNGPSRLFDYAFSPLHLGLKGLGMQTPDGDESETSAFPFQQNPAYWMWLRDSDEAERRQMAQYQADRSIDRSRNAYLRDELSEQFERDFKSLDGKSSGNHAIDYRAIKMGASMVELMSRGISWDEAKGPAQLFASPVGGFQQIPVVGTQIMDLLDPITDEDRRRWDSLTNEQRYSLMGEAGFVQMGADFVSSIPLFSGLGAVLNIARSGGFATIAARHAATAKYASQIGRTAEVTAKLYDRTLRVTNGIMATGLTVATANWAASAVSPWWSENIGREIDASRVVSDSSLAGAVNLTGFFTGFYGVETAIPAWYRAARGRGLGAQSLGFIRSGLDEVKRIEPGLAERPADLSFHRELGGTKLGGILARQYGITHELQGTALSAEFLTTYLNGEARTIAEAMASTMRGGKTGLPFLDRLPVDQRMLELEGILAQEVGRMQGRMGLIVQEVNGRLVDYGTNPGRILKGRMKKMQQASRMIDDRATQRMIERYGARFWPQERPDIEALASKYLQGLGADPDVAALRKFAGKDVTKWHQVLRRLHQVLFFARNGELHAAMEGSEEAGRIGLVSQRHLFADEVEDLANGLVDPDAAAGQALMRALIETKDDVQELDAQGAFKTPEELAAVLIQIGPTLPSRRQLGPTSAAGMLNDLQRVIDNEGFWTLAFKPTGRWTLPEGWVTPDIQPPIGTTRAAMTPETLRAEGYRPFAVGEVMRGSEFSRRDPIWPLAEYGGGVWIREVPGEVTATTATSPKIVIGTEEAWLGSDTMWTHPSEVDPESLWLVQDEDDLGNLVWRRGGNPGAKWPVLIDSDGERYLFKARRNEPDITDLSPARRLAAPTVGKLMVYLGMHAMPEVPFEFNGVKGTIQKFADGAQGVGLTPADLDNAPLHWIRSLQEHVLLDWLTSQHDSNAGSFLAWSEQSPLIGIDKGQAWSAFGKPEELAAFNDPSGLSYWGWRSPGVAEPHLGEFMLDWMQSRGIILDRADIEPLLQKIEDIPEATFRNWLRPLAQARVAEGRFEGSVDEFLDAMVQRRLGLRAFANRGYEYIGGNAIAGKGEPLTFKQGGAGLGHIEGSPIPVNGPRAVSGWEDFPESMPDMPPGGLSISGRGSRAPAKLKAGAIIFEEDGSVWTVDVKGRFAGHFATFPKGHSETADFDAFPDNFYHGLRQTAIREVEEKTGFSVTLVGHVTDYVDPDGGVIRYYAARRTGGGPVDASPKETTSVTLATPEQAASRLLRIDKDTAEVLPDPREQAVLQAFLDWRNPAKDPEAAVGGEPMVNDAPGDAGVDDEPFMSYVKLPGGAVFRSPWMEYPMSLPEHIEMGNRGVFKAKFDDVFRGWRTYRLSESQRASMHRRLSRLDVGMTPAKIDMLHAKVLELSQEYKVPPQAFVVARDWMPFANKAYKDLEKAVEEIVGVGPYLGRDGTIRKVDWRREMSKAYQTSLKLNATAGLTSRFYTLGGVGAASSFVSHVIYPAFRFGLSPLFKAGEYAESWILNALRGVNPQGGDPFTESLMFEIGIGHSRGQIRQELSSDPMLQGMTAFSVVTDEQVGQRDLFFRAPIGEGILERARAQMNDDHERTLLETLFDRPVDTDLYPETYPDIGLEMLIPHKTDETGAEILDFDARRQDDAIISEDWSNWLEAQGANMLAADSGGEGLHAFGAGMAFVESLGDDFIDRLAKAVLPMHTMSSSSRDLMEHIEEALREGKLPLAGYTGLGRSEVLGKQGTGEAALSTARYTSPNVGEAERVKGHVDAYYAGLGEWSAGSSSIHFVLRPEVWQRALITTTDRMGLMDAGPSTMIESVLSPAGAFRRIRQKIFQGLHRIGSGNEGQPVNDLDSVFNMFSSMRPVEFAVPGGSSWKDIEAMILPEAALGRWVDLVQQYGDDIPELKAIKVIPKTDARGDPDLHAYWWERAGLADQRYAAAERAGAFIEMPEGSFNHLLPDDIITPETADLVIKQLSDTYLPTVGIGDELAGVPRQRYFLVNNFEDNLRRAVAQMDRIVVEHKARFENETLMGGGSRNPSQLESVTKIRNDMSQLLADVESWRSGPGRMFDDIRQAREALADDATKKEAESWLAGWYELFEERWLRQIDRSHLIAGHQPYAPLQSVNYLEPSVSELAASRSASTIWDNIGEAPIADVPPVGRGTTPDIVNDQHIAFARYLLDRWRELMPEGYERTIDLPSKLLFSSDMGNMRFVQALTDSLPDALRQRAIAKLGAGAPEPGAPVINVYVNSTRSMNEADEVVIAVIGADGQPYGGLTIDEIADTWKQASMPRRMSEYIDMGDDAFRTTNSLTFRGLWTPEGGPHGSILRYISDGYVNDLGATVAKTADSGGSYWQAPEHVQRIPVRFAYAFDSTGSKAFANISHARSRTWAWKQAGEPFEMNGRGVFQDDWSDMGYDMDAWREFRARDSTGNQRYTYEVNDSMPSLTIVQVEAGFTGPRLRHGDAMLDDILQRFPDKPIRIDVAAHNDTFMQAIANRRRRGELPDRVVVTRRGNGWDDAEATRYDEPTWTKVMDDDEWLRWAGTPEAAIALTPQPPPSGLDDIPGGPEHLTEALITRWRKEIAAAPAAAKAKLEEGFAAFWNPVPFKEMQQDRLIQSIVRNWYPELLAEYIPDMYRFLKDEVGVPDNEFVTFLGRDRALLARWLESGSREDFDKLLMHAEAYKPGTTRAELDELYSRPEWTDMMEVLRLTMRTASDEAFGVHFFNPYRSSFERSINHPLLGVYPASWAYKVAKEWWRFLYDNEMFQGFRLGMAPAAYIAQLQNAQNRAFSEMSDTELSRWYEDGPLGSTIFVFNLLMPGDWSALPFPLSRSIRDALRGQLDPTVHFRNNIVAMGLGRDIRLGTELVGEWSDLLSGAEPEFNQREQPLEDTVFRR